jgi:hypothetical protein
MAGKKRTKYEKLMILWSTYADYAADMTRMSINARDNNWNSLAIAAQAKARLYYIDAQYIKKCIEILKAKQNRHT